MVAAGDGLLLALTAWTLGACTRFRVAPQLVIPDTTSSYFEGDGPEGLAAYGYSRDKRPDRPQLVVGVLMTRDGYPIGHEVFPGDTLASGEGREVLTKGRGVHDREGVMSMDRARRRLVALGALSLILGWVYWTNLPNLTGDATPATGLWSRWALGFGLLVAIAGMAAHRLSRRMRWVLVVILGFLALLQVPPVLLWFLFHGQVISDGPTGPMGNALWAVPHLAVAAGALAMAWLLLHRTIKA